jgi:mono/diheme cytochrome c family protein
MRSYLIRLAPTILVTALLFGCSPAAPAAPSPTAVPAAPTSPTTAPTALPTPLPPTPTAAVPTVAAGTLPILPTIAETVTTAPPPTAMPPSATVAPAALVLLPTATPVPPTATTAPPTATTAPPTALSPSQIAATAIAGSIGEQCVASGPQPAKGFVGDPAIGKVLFVQRGCSACHGDQAQGLVGPKLAGTTLSFEAVLHQLRMPRGVMQRYLPSDQSDADECNVYVYVKGLKP